MSFLLRTDAEHSSAPDNDDSNHDDHNNHYHDDYGRAHDLHHVDHDDWGTSRLRESGSPDLVGAGVHGFGLSFWWPAAQSVGFCQRLVHLDLEPRRLQQQPGHYRWRSEQLPARHQAPAQRHRPRRRRLLLLQPGSQLLQHRCYMAPARCQRAWPRRNLRRLM